MRGASAAEWAATDWRERVRIVGGVSAAIAERRHELAAILAHEIGKPLLEALGEVDECVVLIDYYCEQMTAHGGFATEMGPSGSTERSWSIMRPYGVWAVIGPFNFPMALLLGPIAAALIAGNTVVAKPSPYGYLSGLAVYELFRRAGVPAGALQLLTIPDERLGERLYGHRGLDGLDLHRLARDRDAGLSRLLARVPAPGDLRDGRQEPRDRHRLRRPAQGGARRGALGLRLQRAALLGLLARAGGARGPRRVRRAAARSAAARSTSPARSTRRRRSGR